MKNARHERKLSPGDADYLKRRGWTWVEGRGWVDWKKEPTKKLYLSTHDALDRQRSRDARELDRIHAAAAKVYEPKIDEVRLTKIMGRREAIGKDRWFVVPLPWDRDGTHVISGPSEDPHGGRTVAGFDTGMMLDREEGGPDEDAIDRANAEFAAEATVDVVDLVNDLLAARRALAAALDRLAGYEAIKAAVAPRTA